MNARHEPETDVWRPTSQQQSVENRLRALRPAPPAWQEDDVMMAASAVRRPTGFATAPWPLAVAWLCGVAVGILITTGISTAWFTRSPSSSADVTAKTLPDAVAPERGAIAVSEERLGKAERATAQPETLVPHHLDRLIHDSLFGSLSAGVLWQSPLRAGAASQASEVPREEESHDGFEADDPIQQLPVLTPSPSSQRELLRRFESSAVASRIR